MCPLAIHYRPTNHTLHGPFLRVCTTSSCLPKLKFYIIRPTWDKAVKEVCFYLTNQKADFLIVSFPLDAPIMEPYKNIILKNYIPIDELPNFRSASLNHSMHITLYQSKRSKEQSIHRHLAVPTQTTAKQVSSF